jgi:CheY-like chemotaxis protein
MVNDLLDIAKVESGKVEVHASPFVVGDLFGALRGMLRPLLLNESVNLVFENVDERMMAESDEGKVAQILRNLISNALKFTDQGEVRVSAWLTPAAGTISFAVSDTGVGIPPEHQESIFQEFTQLPGRLQNRVKGTGLGLPLSRRLAELLGGRIELESVLGTGSTFTLVIPRVYPEQRDTAETTYLKQGDQVVAKYPAAKGVLVIDDEEAARYLVRHNLQNTHYVLSEATDGHDGLRHARSDQPDLIVLDLMMPGLTGFEVLEELKADTATEKIPVIIFTSKALEPHEEEFLSRNAAAVLPKDRLTRETILTLLGEVLDGRHPDNSSRQFR